jgi:hypothetical protein
MLGVFFGWIATELEGGDFAVFGLFAPDRPLEEDWRRNCVLSV